MYGPLDAGAAGEEDPLLVTGSNFAPGELRVRFGGVAAAIVCESFTRCAQVGQHCGALSFMPKDALRSGAARRRGSVFWGVRLFFFGLCF